MTAKKWLHLCYGGLALYLVLAALFFIFKDKEHGLMFLCGAIPWVIAALIWGKNVNDET